jgi:hypothetical protein
VLSCPAMESRSHKANSRVSVRYISLRNDCSISAYVRLSTVQYRLDRTPSSHSRRRSPVSLQLPAAVILGPTDIGVYCVLMRSFPTYALSSSEPEHLPRLKQRPQTSLPPRYAFL